MSSGRKESTWSRNPADQDRRDLDRQASDDPWQQVRRGAFCPLSMRTSKGVRRIPAVSAFLSHVNEAAAKGDPAAQRVQIKLMKYLDKNGLLKLPEEDHSRPDSHERREEEWAIFTNVFCRIRGDIYLYRRDQFRERFEAVYGPLDDFK